MTHPCDRAVLVKALKAALPFVSETKPFVCWAITEAVKAKTISIWEGENLKSFIMRRIYPHRVVTGWLETTTNSRPFHYPAAVRVDYRRRWVESMIAELS